VRPQRQSLLSFHLRTLKDAGLVVDRREGRWVYYALNPECLETARSRFRAFSAGSRPAGQA
jgi:ArsR family transcriptional regulator, arsenate/arsenite/antimonite-responsive transcriptional repressor